MSLIKEIYESVLYQIHTHQNGDLNFTDFNGRLKIAQLKMLGWLTGSAQKDLETSFVTPYDTQKSKDWLSPLIKKEKLSVVDNKIDKPKDYYGFENMSLLIIKKIDCDEEEDDDKVERVSIDLLDGAKFTKRSQTYIKSLKPSVLKPIAKEVGNTFEILPEDAGNVELEYISYPGKYGKIAVKLDEQFNEEVIDEDNTEDVVWGEWAIEVLSWFIIQTFGVRTRDTELFQMNQAVTKQP